MGTEVNKEMIDSLKQKAECYIGYYDENYFYWLKVKYKNKKKFYCGEIVRALPNEEIVKILEYKDQFEKRANTYRHNMNCRNGKYLAFKNLDDANALKYIEDMRMSWSEPGKADMFHRDFLGQELQIGDEVVLLCKGYRSLQKGKILRLGDFKATIELSNPTKYSGNTFIQGYDQFITIKNIKNEDVE